MAASLTVHGAAGVPLQHALPGLLAGAPRQAPRPVDVVTLSADDFERRLSRAKARAEVARRTRRTDSKTEKTKPKPQPKEEPKDDLKGQVVEVPASDDKRPPKDSRYLARENSRVERETVARHRDESKSRVTNKLQDAASGARKQNRRGIPVPGLDAPTQAGGESGDDRKRSKGEVKGERRKSSKFRLEVPRLDRSEGVDLDLDLPSLEDGRILNRERRPEVRGDGERFELDLGLGGKEEAPGAGRRGEGKGEDGQRSGLPTLEDLRPTLGTIARISGSPSDDHIQDVPEGEGTFLNTREFKYATFFYQVRDSVGQHWKSAVRREVSRRDPTGELYGPGDLTTLLFIRLDQDGRLDEVRIAASSGYSFLDQVAVRAFEQAEVFPNPPKGIVDERGQIKFTFSFTLSTSRRGPLDLFR